MVKKRSARSVETPARAKRVKVISDDARTTSTKSRARKSPAKATNFAAGNVAEKSTRPPGAAIAQKPPRQRRASPAVLVKRVTRAVERELMQIEAIVGGPDFDPDQRTEAERRARMLASLARTLAELRKLRAAEDAQRPADDVGRPRDLDELRRTLWQRLEGLVGRPSPVASRDDEAG